MLGLVMVAAIATMAFVASSASAQEHSVVICKIEIALCPAGELKAAGATLTILGILEPLGEQKHAVLLTGGLLDELCSESHVQGTLTSSLPLHGTIDTLTFGGCGPCPIVEVLNLPYLVTALHLIGAGKHLWLLHVTPTANPIRVHFLNCPLGVGNCEYGSANVLLDVENKPDGKPLILTLEPELVKTAGGIGCPATGKWDANYLTEILNNGVRVNGWLSLDKVI